MDVPVWLVKLLEQSPMLGVCLGVVYMAYRYIVAQHEAHLRMVERYHQSHLASKGAEIDRLVQELDALRKEKDKLFRLLPIQKEKP